MEAAGGWGRVDRAVKTANEADRDLSSAGLLDSYVDAGGTSYGNPVVRTGVGLGGVFVLVCNTMNGPGLVAIPEVFQAAGWLFPTVCLLVVAAVSGVTGELVAESMRLARLHTGRFAPPARGGAGSQAGQDAHCAAPSAASSPSPSLRPRPQASEGLRMEPELPGPLVAESPRGSVADSKAAPHDWQLAATPCRSFGRSDECRSGGCSPAPAAAPVSDGFVFVPRRGCASPSLGLSHQRTLKSAAQSQMSTVSIRYNEIRENPEEALEFAALVGLYFGKNVERVTTVFLSACLLTLGLAQMVIGCQVMDSFFVFLAGRSYALRYAGGAPGLVHSSDLSLTPFGSGFWGISLGSTVVMVVCLILGRMDLSANIGPQILSFLLLCVSVGIFFYHFASTEVDPLEPERLAVVDSGGLAGFLGVVVFNYSFIISVPSLVNEKRSDVSMRKAGWMGVGFMTALYITIGVLGGMAFRINHNDVMADLLYPSTPMSTKLAVFGYTHAIIPAIPIYCILLQYNIEQQKLVTGTKAYLLCNGIPWLIVLVFLYQPAFNTIVSWMSLLINGFVNFTVPLAVYIKAAYVSGHGWPTGLEWLRWGLRALVPGELASGHDAEVRSSVRAAAACLLCITALLLFTIGLNLVEVAAFGQDLVSSNKPAVAAH